TGGDGRLRQFDLVTANPMWNQKFPASTYENDPYERFTRGVPPSSSADRGWVQHMAAGLGDAGGMAVGLASGAAGRGGGAGGGRCASSSSRRTWSRRWYCCRRTCSTTRPRRG